MWGFQGQSTLPYLETNQKEHDRRGDWKSGTPQLRYLETDHKTNNRRRQGEVPDHV